MRPCPFCGRSTLQICDNDRGNPVVWCIYCGCEGPECTSDAEAVEEWSKRDPYHHLFGLEQKPNILNELKEAQ